MGLYGSDLGSPFKATVRDVVKLVFVLQEEPYNWVAWIARIHFQHNAGTKLTENLICSFQDQMSEALDINLQEIGLDFELVNNRIKGSAWHLYYLSRLSLVSIHRKTSHSSVLRLVEGDDSIQVAKSDIEDRHS